MKKSFSVTLTLTKGAFSVKKEPYFILFFFMEFYLIDAAVQQAQLYQNQSYLTHF